MHYRTFARAFLPGFLCLLVSVSDVLAAQDPAGQELHARVAAAVERLSSLQDENTDPLLPAGTVVDSIEVVENVGYVRLSLPADGSLGLPSEDAQLTVEGLLHSAIRPQVDLDRLDVQLRQPGGDYQPLVSFRAEDSAAEAGGPLQAPLRVGDADPAEPVAPMSLGGPVANADGQPVGALTGVVVFAAAGHGWTAGSSSWSLQRGLLLGMNEDYGNLEQLNFFVHHLYNAGATVVPFRPVGYQNNEVVLDNDDAGVTYTGSWSNATGATGDSSKYYEGAVTSGVRYRTAPASASQTATARYTPNLPQAGFYPVYCFTPLPEGSGSKARVRQTYRITHTGGTASVTIDHRTVGRGWIWLGNFYFNAGSAGYVEITNASPDTGYVFADAMRWGNGMGDVVRSGPNSVSGYSREEEASRYWAHSELGIKGRGFSTSIWDSSDSDSNDNVSTAARWAREMNMTDVDNQRWRRIYMEFHSNAAGCAGGPPCTAKGTVALVTSPCSSNYCPTLNQQAYAQLIGEKLEADMVAQNTLWEYTWGLRSNVFTGSYGAIRTAANGDEFDATILEVAFHDSAEDAANLRNAKVRDAVARSTTQGIIQFLSNSTTFPGTQVPNIFPPEAPEQVRVVHNGSGGVVVSWVSGPSRPASSVSGDPATGYKVYRSTDGYGFGQAVSVGNVLTTTLSDIPAGTATYLRVAATNAGGESMPSETLVVRRNMENASQVLVVNGYDRVSRHLNPIQQIPAGPMERPIPRRVNSFDYIVQHAAAMAESGATFDSCANEAVAQGSVQLANYAAVVWILGRESDADKTLNPDEQSLVAAYLTGGGRIFITGSEIGYELDSLNAGRSFYENTLRANWVGDDAGTFSATGAAGIMEGLGTVNFSTASGAPYVASSADRIAPQSGATTILTYSGGTGDGAGIQYDSGVYRVVMFGFPFEAIGSPGVRTDVMARVMGYLLEGLQQCQLARLTSFEGYAPGSAVMFREPRFSGSTTAHLLTSPNSAVVSTEVPAFDGSQVSRVEWQWVDTSPGRWLRLTTASAANVPNPTIDLRRAVRVRLRLDSGSLRLSLGVRETGTDVAIGADGGSTGTIEWVGATEKIDNAPQGVLVAAQPGVWQTITFRPSSVVVPFTGDGYLSTPTGKGVFESLAFAPVDSAGPFVIYLDAIEQPCPPRVDFDEDGDVDQEDFALLQACISGPFTPQTAPECQRARLDGDADVDDLDVAAFLNCMSGPGTVADPACGT